MNSAATYTGYGTTTCSGAYVTGGSDLDFVQYLINQVASEIEEMEEIEVEPLPKFPLRKKILPPKNIVAYGRIEPRARSNA